MVETTESGDAEVARIARHRPIPPQSNPNITIYCEQCHEAWPCDVAFALRSTSRDSEVREARAKLLRMADAARDDTGPNIAYTAFREAAQVLDDYILDRSSEAAPMRKPRTERADGLCETCGKDPRRPHPHPAPTECVAHGPDCALHVFDHMTIRDAVATAIDELDPNDPPVVNLNLLLRDLKAILDATPEVASSGGPVIDASTSS